MKEKKIKEKKVKGIKNISKPSLKERAPSLLFALLALVLAILIFGVLLLVKNIFEEDVTYKEVLVAKTDIPENEIITEGNVNGYFDIRQINALDAIEGSLSDVTALIGFQTKVPLYRGEIISGKDFKNLSKNIKDFKEPVEISIDVGSPAQADGGKIRAGDVVNINIMMTREQLWMNNSLQSHSSSFFAVPDLPDADETAQDDMETEEDIFAEDAAGDTEDIENTEEEDTEAVSDPGTPDDTVTDILPEEGSDRNYRFDYYAEYILENVYVTKVLDSSGVEIAPTDTETSAGILVFTIDKEEELKISEALANCANIRVSKVLDADSAQIAEK